MTESDTDYVVQARFAAGMRVYEYLIPVGDAPEIGDIIVTSVQKEGVYSGRRVDGKINRAVVVDIISRLRSLKATKQYLRLEKNKPQVAEPIPAEPETEKEETVDKPNRFDERMVAQSELVEMMIATCKATPGNQLAQVAFHVLGVHVMQSGNTNGGRTNGQNEYLFTIMEPKAGAGITTRIVPRQSRAYGDDD